MPIIPSCTVYELFERHAQPHERFTDFIRRHREEFYDPDKDGVHRIDLAPMYGVVAWTEAELWAWIISNQNGRGFWQWLKTRYATPPEPGASRPVPALIMRQ